MSSWRWDRTASVHAFSEVSPAGRRSFRHVQTQLLTSRTQMLFAFPERMSNYARTHQATKSQVQIYHRRRNVLACIWRREADLMFLSLLAEYICIVLTLLLQIPYNIYIYIYRDICIVSLCFWYLFTSQAPEMAIENLPQASMFEAQHFPQEVRKVWNATDSTPC